MKKFALVVTFALLSCVCLTQARIREKTLVVPKDKTYVKLDASGQEIGRFHAGQTMTRTVDCAKVLCPETFGKDVVCWKCKERPDTTKVSGVSGERVGPTTTIATATPRIPPDGLHQVTSAEATTEKVVVPSGKIYVKLDAAGHEVARLVPERPWPGRSIARRCLVRKRSAKTWFAGSAKSARRTPPRQ